MALNRATGLSMGSLMLAEFQTISTCPRVSFLIKIGLRQHVVEVAWKVSDLTKEKNEIRSAGVRLFAKCGHLNLRLIAKILCFCLFL